MQLEQCNSHGARCSSAIRAKSAFLASLRISGISVGIALLAGPIVFFVPRYWPEIGLLPIAPEAVALGFFKAIALFHPGHFIAAYVKN